MSMRAETHASLEQESTFQKKVVNIPRKKVENMIKKKQKKKNNYKRQGK